MVDTEMKKFPTLFVAPSGNFRDAERELERYRSDFEGQPFIPFPDVERAVEAVVETAGHCIDGHEYMIEVARRLVEKVNDFYEDWAKSHRNLADIEEGHVSIKDPAAEIARLRSDLSRLRGFAKDIMEYWPDGVPDGADLQEIAAQHGLLEGTQCIVPCGALRCQCADWEAEGEEVTCYRATPLLLAERGGLPDASVP